MGQARSTFFHRWTCCTALASNTVIASAIARDREREASTGAQRAMLVKERR